MRVAKLVAMAYGGNGLTMTAGRTGLKMPYDALWKRQNSKNAELEPGLKDC